MKNCFFFFFLIFSISISAQVDVNQQSSLEDLYKRMKEFANEGDVSSAKSLAFSILAVEPAYSDVSIYLAMLFGREADFDSAFVILNPILEIDTLNGDAHLANCALLYWSNHWRELIDASTRALEIFPGNTDLIYQKALALHKLARSEEAISLLDELFVMDPENIQAKRLQGEIEEGSVSPELLIGYTFDHFRHPYSRKWHMLTAGSTLPIKLGSIAPYLNVGHFANSEVPFIESTAYQLNFDAYLNISTKNYLLLGYGISTADYFPRHRSVIHLWQKLPAAWSVSAGARYFYFDKHYFFYSVGIDKYLGNYWFDLNNYIFRKDYGLSMASYLTVRRYMENKYNYFALVMGYGTSPDEPITSVLDLQHFKAVSLRLQLMKQLSGTVRMGLGVGYQYEEYQEQVFRNRFTAHAGLYFKLK
jgi:YaiO family outer membrane protein